MDCICNFNKKRDIAETSQSGFVDLTDLLDKGIIPANLNIAESDFNNIDDPKSIYGRPKDQFDAMVMAKELNKRGAEAQRLYDERQAALEAAKK